MPPIKKNIIKSIKPISKSKLVNRCAPIKNGVEAKQSIKPKKKRVYLYKKNNHPEYGTSKLEEHFAKNFLDKIGVLYIYQYKMGSIGRYMDFYLPNENVGLEIDGDYYHSFGLVYEQMNRMQKHNKRVDEQKDHWCLINSIKLIRIWEHDINKHPEKVMDMLKKELSISKEEKIKKDIKKLNPKLKNKI